MNANSSNMQNNKSQQSTNQNIQVFVRVRPLNEREKCMRSNEVVSVESAREIVTRHALEAKLTKKFTFDRTFGPESRQVDVYSATVAPLIEEVLAGYNCTVFAYGQTGTGKTHTMVGNELVTLSSAWDDNSDIGIIPRALCHLFDELRMMEVQYSMRVSYLELYNEQLCDLLSTDDNSAKIRIFDDSTKKGSVIINGLEEVTVHNKHDVYKLLEKGQERRKTAKTLMNAQSSRSHTVFSILVHMRETDILSNDEMVKIGKLNLVDLAGSENVSKAGNEKPIRVRETVNINQSLLTLGRVITALVERTPHIPYRESKLTRLLQESLGGRTKTAIIATVSPGHKDIEETLSTLEYAHRAKNIQNKPELNQKISQRAVLNQYTEEIDKLKRDLMAVREKNGIYLADETYYEMTTKMDSQCRELNEKALLLKALKDELAKKEKTFNEISLKLIDETTAHRDTQIDLKRTENNLQQVQQSLQITKLRYKEKKMLLNEHVKTEEELISQATEILEVADVATEDTVKLHSTIERRKSVDEKIATAGERLISHVNDNFKQMDTHIFTAHKHNNKLLEMTLDELRCGTEYLEELHKKTHDKNLHIKNNFSTQMQEIMKMLSASHQEMCSMNEADNQKDNIKFKSILQKTQNFVKELLTDFELWQSSSKAEKQALKELQTIAEALKQQRTTANVEHVAKLQQEVESMRAALKESNQAINTLQEQLKKEKQLQSQSKHELVEFQQKLQQQMQTQMNNYVQQMFDNMESQLSVSENKASDLLKANQQHEKLLGNCVDLSIAYGQQQEQHEKNALKNTLEYIEKRHACVQQQEVKQAELCKEIEVYEVEHKIELEEICSEHEAHKKLLVNHAENLLKSQEEKLCSVSADLSEAHDNLQTLVFENCQSIHEKHTLCGSLLCSLQTDVWDKLNGQYAELRNNCVKNITEIKQTELKTYQPTGMTPSKRDFQYPRTLKCTSPHDKLIKRFRLQHNDSEMDLSQITILEDSDGETLEDTQVIMPEMKIKQLNSTPLPEKNVENSSINSVLSSFENVESSIPLSLSRKRNNSTLVVKADNSNDKENDTL